MLINMDETVVTMPPGPIASPPTDDEEAVLVLQTEDDTRCAINGDALDSRDNTSSPSPTDSVAGEPTVPVDKEQTNTRIIQKNEAILSEDAMAKSRGRPQRGSRHAPQQVQDTKDKASPDEDLSPSPVPSPPSITSVQSTTTTAGTTTTSTSASSAVEDDRSKRKAARRRKQKGKDDDSNENTRSSGGTYRSSGARRDIEEGLYDDYSDEDDDEATSSQFPGATRVRGSKTTLPEDEDDAIDDFTINHVSHRNYDEAKNVVVPDNEVTDLPAVLEAVLVEEDPPTPPVPTPQQLVVSAEVMAPTPLDATAMQQQEEFRKSFEEFLAIKAREEGRFGNNWCGCTRCTWAICGVLCTCLILLLIIMLVVGASASAIASVTTTIESLPPTMAPTGSPTMM